MKWLTSLFGGSDAAEKTMDLIGDSVRGIGSFIDEQTLTDEEKAVFNAKIIGHYSDFIKSTVAENTQRSLTRRSLSIWVIRFEIMLLALSIALYKIDVELSLFVYKVATTEPMSYLVLGIGAFFWGTHLVRSLPKKS